MSKRPSWVPKSAVAWGYKSLTKDRKSPVKPSLRLCSCWQEKNKEKVDLSNHGTILNYPKGKIVQAKSFCKDSLHLCCYGLHFYPTRKEAGRQGWLHTGEILVRCYIPKGGRIVSSDKKSRADKLVCL